MSTTSRPRLAAEPRTVTGKKVAILRREGKVPAVVYGHGHGSQPVQLDAHELELLRRHTGRNAILDLAVGKGKVTPVIVAPAGMADRSNLMAPRRKLLTL